MDNFYKKELCDRSGPALLRHWHTGPSSKCVASHLLLLSYTTGKLEAGSQFCMCKIKSFMCYCLLYIGVSPLWKRSKCAVPLRLVWQSELSAGNTNSVHTTHKLRLKFCLSGLSLQVTTWLLCYLHCVPVMPVQANVITAKRCPHSAIMSLPICGTLWSADDCARIYYAMPVPETYA